MPPEAVNAKLVALISNGARLPAGTEFRLTRYEFGL
jgi:hypothetical protein